MKHNFYKTLLLGVFVLCMFGFSNNTSHAYFTTDQKTIPLDNGSQLFVITYTFGHKNHVVGMPYLTSSSTLNSTSTLTYAVVDKHDVPVTGNSSAIILSNFTTLNNNMYEVPKGKKQAFTLLVVFKPADATSKHDYRLQVTGLPFNFDGKQQLGLNTSELQYYVTPYTDL